MGHSRLAVLCSFSFLCLGSAANADILRDVCGDVCRVLDQTGQVLGAGARKLVTELGNGANAVSSEIVNGAKRIADEIENAGEDLVILIETGQCGGDICTALDAMVVYTRATLEAQVQSIQQATERLQDGKIVDAVWHLGVDPLNAQQEAAAQAAIRSSIIRAVGQAAATAYGGGAPGAAGYSAWLAYHQTGGDLDLALRAGVIAGATSAVMDATGTLAEGADIKAHLAIDQMARRAITSGAVAGAAVAASGGDQADVEKAAVAGIAMSVLRDGYTRLTAQDFDEESLKHSIGDGPCLGNGPDGNLPCADEARASGALDVKNGEVRTDYTKLSKRMPHVGAVSDGVKKAWSQEDSDLMVFLSRFPGMNAMGHAHDAYIESLVGTFDEATLDIINKATIPPFVVMTYTAAGFDTHELIRQEIAARAEGKKPSVPLTAGSSTTAQPLPPSGTSGEMEAGSGQATPPTIEYTTVPGLPLAAGEQFAAEIRQLVCLSAEDVRTTVLEILLDPNEGGGAGHRICSVDRLGENGLINFWHAHHQVNSCIDKFNEVALLNIRQGRECALSIGVRYGVEANTADTR